ncbi:hypothetical protein [Vibrio vulnificus]|uniref:hypothetical protein n=1 Tax=Vibrio vulnificus TaxID=672 RepID=UPI00192D3568|nr:hypothetical protein [Vibrio vulnificus]MBL6179195.1 hypothetical protein [Vibrio vulnificus]HDY7983667.1 hypothetical protein [Vibrio vulnificus]HDY8007128.1 hypothetical protein [Vibrio vulnificus]HDY8095769.1 hypothetical protein [Vibrio vulnificus]HDY8118425.1 hypothetical protein [Vibrio vulnificus]
MKKAVLEALDRSMLRVDNPYPIDREVDFQSVFFGELYKALPEAIIRFEHTLQSDYQSYRLHGSSTASRKSRVDLHVQTESKTIVIELKYFKGASKEERLDMLADLAKVERIVESEEAHEGFCIQLVKAGVIERLRQGMVEARTYKEKVGRWDYNFEIKGQYEIIPRLQANGRSLIVHHIQ